MASTKINALPPARNHNPKAPRSATPNRKKQSSRQRTTDQTRQAPPPLPRRGIHRRSRKGHG